MREELLKRLLPITEEERKILEEKKEIQKDIYTATEEFTIDSRKMLEKVWGETYTREGTPRTEIKIAQLGNDAGIIGAAVLGM